MLGLPAASEGVLAEQLEQWWKLLSLLVPLRAGMGSFDCAAASRSSRFAQAGNGVEWLNKSARGMAPWNPSFAMCLVAKPPGKRANFLESEKLMKSPTAFRVEAKWSATEKKIARKAYEAAFLRQCTAITAKAKKMFDSSSPPDGIWRLHDYLSRERRKVDLKYDYRYSVLISVFAQLLSEGWLKKEDLEGLAADKIEQIEHWAKR